MASTTDRVRIHYHRPPDREEIFEQRLVDRSTACIVTLLERLRLDAPIEIDGTVALEDRSPIVWFTFPGEWHDIGRFHRADGTFTGIYANVLTPVRFLDASTWSTTDLFLDLWQDRTGTVRILDEDELRAALDAGWIDGETGAKAQAEAERLAAAAAAGRWPPPVVDAWTLERARGALAAR